METKFATRLVGQPGNYNVVVYGLNKYSCSNCKKEFYNKDYVYTCEAMYTDNTNKEEYRILNCDNCERKKKTACVNAHYDGVRNYHIHCLAIMRICPNTTEIEDFLRDIIK